jgi:hypothetical protein
MGKSIDKLSPHHIEFIEKQKVFFVATAPDEGFINLSPKGMDSFRVINEKTVVWLNLTGSGNETAAHLLDNTRMTIMMCAFEGPPMILRLYGQARSIHSYDEDWDNYTGMFPNHLGTRQFHVLDLEKVMTSCGFGVPIMEFKNEREELRKWSEKKGEEGILAYQQEHNLVSLNGKDTGLNGDF